jgi:hypothetical protein
MIVYLCDFRDSDNFLRIVKDRADSPAFKTDLMMCFEILIATLVLLGTGLLLVWFAVLREDQMFWRNAGGYPLWLRNVVHLSFLPLFAVSLIGHVGVSMVFISEAGRVRRMITTEAVILLLCWGLMGTSGTIALKNNVCNLIEGRDLHYHESRR